MTESDLKEVLAALGHSEQSATDYSTSEEGEAQVVPGAFLHLLWSW